MTKCEYQTDYVEKNDPNMKEKKRLYECKLPAVGTDIITEPFSFSSDSSLLNKKTKVNKLYCDDIKAKSFCHFHNRDYALNNEEKVMQKFCDHIKSITYDKTEETISSPANSVKRFGFPIDPVMCIGFHIPGELNFDGKKFTNPIYFTRAEFYKKVTFKDFTFYGYANFHYARFHNKAIFSNTCFNAEANFSNCSFQKDAYFTGTPEKGSGEPDSKPEIRTTFNDDVNFYHSTFHENAFFSGAKFINKKESKDYSVNFTHINFKGEADFDSSAYDTSIFPSLKDEDKGKPSKVIKDDRPPPVKFDDTTFRERVRFMGETSHPLYLGLVSLKGVDLTNALFHNVEWLKIGFIWKRNAIFDELRLHHMVDRNYHEVSGIYNQLRKNYEANLYYDDASDFYVGNMETIKMKLSKSEIRKRKLDPAGKPVLDHKDKPVKMWSIRKQGIRDRFKAGVYWMYRLLNQYGESTFVPLLVWTPLIITIFAGLRYYDTCFVYQNPQISQVIPVPEKYIECDFPREFVNSLFAYFQFPLDEGWDRFLDTIERIVSAPILAIAIKSFALTKRFETAIR